MINDQVPAIWAFHTDPGSSRCNHNGGQIWAVSENRTSQASCRGFIALTAFGATRRASNGALRHVTES
jgi:hypothetical protein